jgi:hypothetical protein
MSCPDRPKAISIVDIHGVVSSSASLLADHYTENIPQRS